MNMAAIHVPRDAVDSGAIYGQTTNVRMHVLCTDREAKIAFQQKCIYLSVAGQVEFV